MYWYSNNNELRTVSQMKIPNSITLYELIDQNLAKVIYAIRNQQ